MSSILLGGLAGVQDDSSDSGSDDYGTMSSDTALAEPLKIRRERVRTRHNIPISSCYTSWEDLLDAPKVADAVVICVADRLHRDVAVGFSNRGYHILLEKPMATDLESCKDVYAAAKRNNVLLAVCHVLRYTAYNRKIKEIVDSGALGDIVGIQHMEPVGHFHFAHSYVRGNWRKESESSSSLLAKSCHDIDIMMYFMGDGCERVSSFGGISHFKKGKKPDAAGASTRCTSCAYEPQCPYSAKKIYLEPAMEGYKEWPVDVITDVVDVENITDALLSGPYGRCVYECDNDVCDNQVVNIEFKDSRYATFSMVAFTKDICTRKTRIFGTRGELVGDDKNAIEVYNFLSRRSVFHDPDPVPAELPGHGGGDLGIIKSFVEAIAFNNPGLLPSNSTSSFASHVVVFAAEEARRCGNVVNIGDFCKKNGIEF
ncbi:hypothetical protein EV177_005346 [Coemansia sp. RSA 1804]|nr:hypothetical protein EV177_005346 [Coemansia sp. RSA 1804]